MEADFAGQRSRRDIVGSTESGKEVVERDFVGHVDDREARAPSVTIAVKQIIVTDRQVKQVAWGNARWIVIIVLGAGRGYLDVLGTILRGRAEIRA